MTEEDLMYAGLTRYLEVGLRLSPTTASAPFAARAIARILDCHQQTPVRIVGVGRSDSRVILTLGVTMGTIDEIKSGAPAAKMALAMLSRLVEQLSSFDPALTALPASTSVEARFATHLSSEAKTTTLAEVVDSLVACR